MAKNIGDQYVYNVQVYLNQTYGNDNRYNKISEDGYIGWKTIYAMTRALQIELGIEKTADSFGPTTISKFNTMFPNGIIQQDDNDTSENNIYAIIQCALLCKGYGTGLSQPTKHFYNGTGNAVKKLKTDAGCVDTSSTVTLNIMKALLSMDYFYSYDTSEKTINIQAIQRYLNNNYENYIGLTPCDGVYNRSTNKALIYAIQAEEGMPISVANGNFGPSTKRCCPSIPYNNVEKDYNNNVYNSTKITKFITLLNMALYVNGVGTGIFDTGYNKELVEKFQKKYALPITGICNLTTWLSLFVSCGDTSRTALACDCATILTKEKAQTLYNKGYRYIGRYLSGTISGGISKALTVEEMQIAFDVGLRIFPIQQSSANTVSYFTPSQAENDVNSAYIYASNLKIPAGTVIYFAVDCDPLDSQITSNIIPYFKKVFETMKNEKKGKYRIGIYGTRNVCTRVSENGYAECSFVSDMSTGFSGNLGFPIPNNWAFDQFSTITVGSGTGSIEIDKDGFSGRDIGIGNFELTDLTKVFTNLVRIYDLALDYTNNNISESNLLTLEYLRYLKGGAYGNFSDEYDDKWTIMAGSIDSTFCNYVERELGTNLDLSFKDVIKPEIYYDLLHMCATLNAILFPVIHEDWVLFDTILDSFAGWAGDVVTFADDIRKNGNSQDWANNNICINDDTAFGIRDYFSDVDAVVIGTMMKADNKLSFPHAFIKYFSYIDFKYGNLYCATRTNRFLIEMGTINEFIITAENYICSDTFPYPTLRNMLRSELTEQEHMDKAYIAFMIFVGNESLKED